jgi:integrase
MALGKQAKIVGNGEFKRVLEYVSRTRNPARDRCIVMLSFKAGLRAKEIAGLKWSMVTDAAGELTDEIALTNDASKGKAGGRTIPISPPLRDALAALMAERGDKVRSNLPVIYSERGRGFSAESMRLWWRGVFDRLGMRGASSHSGRRTFVTNAARKAVEAGCSLRDVQQLAGHANLTTTQRYIEGSTEGKRKLVALI